MEGCELDRGGCERGEGLEGGGNVGHVGGEGVGYCWDGKGEDNYRRSAFF